MFPVESYLAPTVEGQEARCYVFYFFESLRGRDYFLSPEKTIVRRSTSVYLMHYHNHGLRHDLF